MRGEKHDSIHPPLTSRALSPPPLPPLPPVTAGSVTSRPQLPAKAISSSAVSRPPSERSWPAAMSLSSSRACVVVWCGVVWCGVVWEYHGAGNGMGVSEVVPAAIKDQGSSLHEPRAVRQGQG